MKQCVDRAMKLIKVKYEVLPAVLDYHEALDNPILVHPEDNWKSLYPVGADNKRNLCAHMEDAGGDVEKTFAKCDVVLERTYHVPAVNQAMMETFRTYLLYRHLWPSGSVKLHADRLPCPQDLVQCTGHSEKQESVR